MSQESHKPVLEINALAMWHIRELEIHFHHIISRIEFADKCGLAVPKEEIPV